MCEKRIEISKKYYFRLAYNYSLDTDGLVHFFDFR